MTLVTLEEAQQDLVGSVDYYESKQPGLGARLRDEVAATMEWFVLHPTVPRLRRKLYRRVNLRRFPHYVVYVIRGNTIWVVAIAHGHRRPEFWRGR